MRVEGLVPNSRYRPPCHGLVLSGWEKRILSDWVSNQISRLLISIRAVVASGGARRRNGDDEKRVAVRKRCEGNGKVDMEEKQLITEAAWGFDSNRQSVEGVTNISPER